MRRTVIVFVFALLLIVAAGCREKPHDAFPYPAVGSVAEFQPYPHWHVSGRVRVLDERTLRFEDFTFSGDATEAEIRLKNGHEKVATLKVITGETYDHATFDLPLPDRVTLQDFNLVSVHSVDFGEGLSGAAFR